MNKEFNKANKQVAEKKKASKGSGILKFKKDPCTEEIAAVQ